MKIDFRLLIGSAMASSMFLAGCSDDTTLTDGQLEAIELNPTATQQIAISECGSMPIMDLMSSSNVAAPAGIAEGGLVAARVDPETATNREHFWTIDLSAGLYTLISENNTVSGDDGNIGLTIFGTVGGEDELRLSFGNEIDHKIRQTRFFELTRNATVQLKIEPTHDAEDYVLGVFRNGNSIPAPFFRDCPEITPTTLDTTEAFVISSVEEFGEGEKWFEVDLASGNYTLSVDAAFIDGESSNLQLKALSYDQFGQIDRENRVISMNEIDSMFSDSGSIRPGEAGKHWIRYFHTNPDMSVNATLTRD